MTFRTYPDFGAAQSGTIAPDIDIAELAARMGSPVTWRRDGRVLSLTNFSPDADGWVLSSGGATVEIASSDYIYSGDASCHLFTTVNPPATGNIYKRIPIPSSARIGLEAMICENVGVDHDVYFTLYRKVDNANYTKAGVKIEMITGRAYYLNNVGAYVLFYTRPAAYTREMNHNFKLVVDFANTTYLRFFTDDVLVEMPYIPQNIVGALDIMVFEINITPHVAGGLINIFVDNTIITCSEY